MRLIVWAISLTLLCYGSALRLPLFADDFFQFPFVTSHSLLQLWQTAEGLFFFRPLAFTMWKVLHLAIGRNDPFALHALNLLFHAGNGVLVAWLAGELWPTDEPDSANQAILRRYLTATLFLLYPFSYEAVAWVAAVMHPQVVALILWSVVGYLKWQQGNGRWWGLFSLLCAFLAPFAHENGVLVAPLIAVVEWTRPSRNVPWWHRIALVILWGLSTLVWFFIWRSVPAQDGAGSLTLNSGKTLWQNSLYFAQGVAYPLTWIGGWLRDRFSLNGFTLVAVFSLLALPIAAFVQWRSHDKRTWLPWLWILVSIAPAVLFLPFLHVSAAPRMLMLPGVGIAWLWADVFLSGFYRRGRKGRGDGINPLRSLRFDSYPFFPQIGTAALILFLLLQNVRFIQAQLEIYQLGGSAIRQAVAATVTANEQGETAVFINLPAWIAPFQATYAIGQEGDIFILGPDQVEPMISVHTGKPAQIEAVRYDPIRQEMPYHSGPVGEDPDWANLSPGTQVFVTRYTPDIQIQPAGEWPGSPPTNSALAQFPPFLTLRDASATLNEQQLQIGLTWQAHESLPPDVTLFVHVIDGGGQLVAQADGDPLAGSYPFGQWPPGTIVTDRRVIPSQGLSADLSVSFGLYNRVTGERLTAVLPSGVSLPDNAVIIPVVGE